VEATKNEAIYGQWVLKRSVKEADLIFLHSGGNLGDRGVWSERGRRLVINNFRKNKIVSLPQTIFFSDTAEGSKERANSQRIYNAHPLLTIMSRDQKSLSIAKELFHNANHLLVPDFVTLLSLKFFGLGDRQPLAGSTLAIIRNDSESAFQGRWRGVIENLVSNKAWITDTETNLPLPSFARKFMVTRFLRRIQGFEIVVTDRLHGLIFSILANRPTVVLGTIDHKLQASFQWFADTSPSLYCQYVDELPELLSKARSLDSTSAIDFKALYFDLLPAKLNTHSTE
jgi:exopolysaccharide biosynthesis predicted pyruvyltransferase EpsI